MLSRIILTTLLASVITTIPTAPAAAAPEELDALALPDRVIQAHRDLGRVRIDATFTAYFSYPDETEFASSDYGVWLDRDAQLLRIERPGFTLVCDGWTVYLRSETIPGRHLEAPLQGDLTYDAIVSLVPDVNDPVPPALVLLLADEPMPWLSEERTLTADALKPRDDDPAARPRVRMPTMMGEFTLWCTAESLLLEDAVQIADPKQLAGSGLVDVRWHHRLRVEPRDEPFDDTLFQFDTEGSEACDTMAQLLAPPPNPNAGANNGGPTLLGRSLPDIDLDTLADGDPINLTELGDGLVIVEFFATWTRPSLTDLGDLHAYRDWAEDEEIDVQVYTVNVLEKSKAVRDFFERLSQLTEIEYDLPVLMDVTGEAAIELGLPALPRTVILFDGEIIDVLGGRKPEFLQTLQDRTPEWMGEATAEDSGE